MDNAGKETKEQRVTGRTTTKMTTMTLVAGAAVGVLVVVVEVVVVVVVAVEERGCSKWLCNTHTHIYHSLIIYVFTRRCWEANTVIPWRWVRC